MASVWYVAYGSNLGLRRFGCYLSGGRPEGGRRVYVGCRDPRLPGRIESLTVPGGVVFAGESGMWGGGMALYDAAASRRVACRAYLVTTDQFADITAQEMRRRPGGEFARELAQLLPDIASVQTLGPGMYETIVRLGERDGAPLLTVTSSDVVGLKVAAPRAGYLRSICRGLREAHNWEPDRVASYLVGAPGVVGTWTKAAIAEIATQDTP